MRRLGVRGRVVLPFAVVMAVLLALAGLAISSGMNDQLADSTDNELETRASAVARLMVERGAVERGLTAGLDDPGESFTQILDDAGRVVLSSAGLPDGPLLRGEDAIEDAAEGVEVVLRGVTVEPELPGDEELDREALQETTPEAFEDDRARLIARAVTVDGRPYTVIVGDTLEDRADAERALRQVLLIALPLSLVAACLVGWFAIGAALRPVERMRRQASGISEQSAGERLEVPEADDELRRLAETLNAMLDRLEGAIERERAFASDASHELRTPLAILRTELELALRGARPAEDLREAIASALEETSRLSALADGLLVLARADSDRRSIAGTDTVDLGAVASSVAARFGVAPPTLPTDEPADVRGDALRLEQAVANLVENALRHGAPPIDMTVARRAAPRTDGRPARGDVVEVVVGDRGPGVPESFLPRAFERFSRADAARSTPGTGLGLSIAQAIAQAHGGDVTLDPRPGGGTLARLTVLSSDGP